MQRTPCTQVAIDTYLEVLMHENFGLSIEIITGLTRMVGYRKIYNDFRPVAYITGKYVRS